MFKKSLLAITILAGAAHAQTPDAGTTPPPAPAAPSGDVFQKGTLGFSFPITLISNFASSVPAVGIEPVPTIDILYFLDNKAALDLIAGFNLHHFEQTVVTGTPPMSTTSTVTVFGFAAGAGYRMYTHKDKLHAYIEPSVVLLWPDTSTSSTFAIQAGGAFGAERLLTDWMSLSGAIGAGISFADSFKDIQLETNATLAANFYWH